jgi:hypothetical protein
MVAVAALIAGMLTIASAPPASACAPLTKRQVFRALRAGNMETVTLRTFHLDVKLPKTVAIGEVAKIKVNVTRPADEDPIGLGVPTPRPTTQPAEDAIVGVGLMIGNVFLPGAALTDAKGDAVVKIKIEPWAPAAPVNVSIYAWRVAYNNACLTVQEDGYEAMPRAFKTTD